MSTIDDATSHLYRGPLCVCSHPPRVKALPNGNCTVFCPACSHGVWAPTPQRAVEAWTFLAEGLRRR